ncbi:unnamed protein product [Orchesella dallaii]|uniref:F-box domain-containing protein n=1 Tax=Orchesella dallaii TaxID=48710 RepID=A0ABP1S3A4_9HEXA
MEVDIYDESFGPAAQVEQNYGLHPMLIDHVVERILESMDPELLGHYCKIFRCVSKDWCRVATRVYRQRRGRITFKKNFIGRVTELFIRVMRTSADIPFDKFRFCTDSYDDENFGDLLHECSGAIVNLELLLTNPCDLKFPKDFPDLVLGRLKCLTMHVRIDSQAELQPEMPSLLASLLRASPNLRRLDLKVFGGTPKTIQMMNIKHQLVKKFGDALVNNFPPSVKELKLNITLTDEQLLKLSEMQKDILSLEVYFQQSTFGQGTLQQLLESVAPTLLHCKAVGSQFLVDMNFPIFPRLQYLVALGRPPPLLCYKQVFPRLNKLEICLWDEDQQGSVFPDNCQSETVAEMDFPYAITKPLVITRISYCFQNLKILRNVIIGSFAAMSMIFEKLRSLSELDVYLGAEFHDIERRGLAVDAVFTGFPPEMCEWLLRHKEYCSSPSTLVQRWEHKSSLRRLRNLKTLRLSACHMRSASTIRLTDITVNFALLQMENLERLHLDFFPTSEKSVERLDNRFRLTRPC